MSETKSISQWFKNENASLRTRAITRLNRAGLTLGAFVRKKADGSEYVISSIQFAGITPYGGYISLHGNKLLRNDMLGTHEHYIGMPEDVTVEQPVRTTKG